MIELLQIIANTIGWIILIPILFITSLFLFGIIIVFIYEIKEKLKRKWGL